MAKVTAVFANGQPLDQEGLNQLKTATNLHEDQIAAINTAIGNSTTTAQLAQVVAGKLGFIGFKTGALTTNSDIDTYVNDNGLFYIGGLTPKGTLPELSNVTNAGLIVFKCSSYIMQIYFSRVSGQAAYRCGNDTGYLGAWKIF